MISTLAVAVLELQDQPLKMKYEIPVSGMQREIVLGPKPQEYALLNGTYEREVQTTHLATGSNTPGYVDNIIPGGTAEDNLGYFDCVTKPDNIFNKDCVVITSVAKWNQQAGHKPNIIKWQDFSKQQYWVTADGTILRHYYLLQTPEGMQSADCVYGKDSIQRRYTDVHNKVSFGDLYPSCGMDALNAQFKPMVVDGKIVMRDKEYCVVNPLTGGIEKYSVHSAGTFKGEFLSATFKGKVFEIDGPNNLTEKAMIDDSGDLVKVALSDEKYFVISMVPTSHMDENGHPIRKAGGG